MRRLDPAGGNRAVEFPAPPPPAEGTETEYLSSKAALLFPVALGTMGPRLLQEIKASESKSRGDEPLTQSLLRGNNSH